MSMDCNKMLKICKENDGNCPDKVGRVVHIYRNTHTRVQMQVLIDRNLSVDYITPLRFVD